MDCKACASAASNNEAILSDASLMGMKIVMSVKGEVSGLAPSIPSVKLAVSGAVWAVVGAPLRVCILRGRGRVLGEGRT